MEHFINQQWDFVGVNQIWKHHPPPRASYVTKPAAQGVLRTLLVRCNCCKLMIDTLAHEIDWGLNDHILEVGSTAQLLSAKSHPFPHYKCARTHHTMPRCVVRGKG